MSKPKVLQALSEKVDLSGGTMTGALTLNANPTADMSAATKKYVDSLVALAGGFEVGASAPTNTQKLWIDTTATTGGLKYYQTSTSSWVAVPVQFT